MINIYYFNTGLTMIAEERNGVLEYPMIFSHQIDNQGRVSIVFQPLFMFLKDPKIVLIDTSGLLFKSEAEEKMKEKYEEIVTQAKVSSSGLIIPGGPVIQMKPNVRKP